MTTHAEPEQLALLEPAPPKLTERQEVVHEALQRAAQDGLDADQAGAIAHTLKQDRWAHHEHERCQFCGRDGKQILEALKAKGLATYRRANRARSIPGAWLATDLHADAEADTSLPRGMTDTIPY